jgi:hypothetical protein
MNFMIQCKIMAPVNEIYKRCTDVTICSCPSCIRVGAGVNAAPGEKKFVLPLVKIAPTS